MTQNTFKCLLFFLLFLAIHITLASTPLPRTNLELTQLLIQKFVEKLYLELQKFPDSTYSIKAVNHPISQYIEGMVVSELSNRNLRFYNSESDTIARIEVIVNQFKIEYTKIPNEESKLKRTIKFSVTSLLKKKNSPVSPIKFEHLEGDTIDEDLVGYIERDGEPFKGELPPEKETFFDQYIEPIVVILSSAIVVLLFFSVRSK